MGLDQFASRWLPRDNLIIFDQEVAHWAVLLTFPAVFGVAKLICFQAVNLENGLRQFDRVRKVFFQTFP